MTPSLRLLCSLVVATQTARPDRTVESWDCAHTALFVVMSLHGKSCDPQTLHRILTPKAEGISTRELAVASTQLGLALRPVSLSKGNCTQFGSFIAFAEHEGKPYGHFLVVRPIGKSYLQLIDPPQVRVVAVERMFPEPSSTVVALIHQRANPTRIVGWAVTLAAAFVGVVITLRIRVGRRRSG